MLGHRTLNVEDYLAMFKRRWWIVAIPAVLLTIAGYGITFVIPPVYESQTLVLIDQQKVPEDFVPSIVNEDLDSRVASMNEQILSRSSLLPIVEKYNLYGDQHMDMDTRVDRVRKDITLQAIRSEISHAGGLPGFKIFFHTSDPQRAQQVCADITSLFTKINMNSRQDQAEGTTSFIREQLAEAKQKLDDQDKKLADFQRQYFGMLPEDEKDNHDVLSSMNAQLDSANGQIQNYQLGLTQLETQLAQQQATTASPAASPTRTPQAEELELNRLMAQRDDLTSRYTADYPAVKDVNRKIAELQAQMDKEATAMSVTPAAPVVNRPDSVAVQQLRTQIASVRVMLENKNKQREQLEQQIRIYEGRVQSSPQVAEQEKELTRDHLTAQTQYDSLYNQMHQAEMATDLETRSEGETFRVLDQANLPDAPTYPKLSVFVPGGLAVGIGLGLMIVALLEYRDTALRTERDVWAFTQLPTLAIIAWSAGLEEGKPGLLARLKRPFSRKTPKKLATETPG